MSVWDVRLGGLDTESGQRGSLRLCGDRISWTSTSEDSKKIVLSKKDAESAEWIRTRAKVPSSPPRCAIPLVARRAVLPFL